MRVASSSCFSIRNVSRVASMSRHPRSRQVRSTASSRVLIRVRRAARSSASTGILRRPIVAPMLELVRQEMCSSHAGVGVFTDRGSRSRRTAVGQSSAVARWLSPRKEPSVVRQSAPGQSCDTDGSRVQKRRNSQTAWSSATILCQVTQNDASWYRYRPTASISSMNFRERPSSPKKSELIQPAAVPARDRASHVQPGLA